MKNFVVAPNHKILGELKIAADKSISHRAVLLSSLAAGETVINNVLQGEDVKATIAAMRACGVGIEDAGDKTLRVVADGELRPPSCDIDCGNSGTLMRIFCGLAAGKNLPCRLVGDDSLSRRPMSRISQPLADMGASVKTAAKGRPPVELGERAAGTRLRGVLYYNALSSAQVKSAILLAGMFADGTTIVAEPSCSRDHTERMLETFGIPLRRSADGRLAEISAAATLQTPGTIDVPADISSAMFFMVAAAITPESDILLPNVGINPTRIGGLELLQRMGADVDIINRRTLGAEPVADIRICGGELHGIDIGAEDVPSAIDDFPALFIAAASARGTTRLSGAAELRQKESDRISSMAAGLDVLGVECKEQPDGITIVGKNGGKPSFGGGVLDSNGDHRVAMAFVMASLRAKGEITIRDCDNVQTSFPNFVKAAAAAGIRISESESAEE